MKQFIIIVIVVGIIIGLAWFGFVKKSQAITENPLPSDAVEVQIENQGYYTNDYEIRTDGVIVIHSYYLYDVFSFTRGYDYVEKTITSNQWTIKK